MALNPLVDSRDVRFILFELLEIEKLGEQLPEYGDYDRDTYDEFINLAERIAVEQLYPASMEADKQGVQYIAETKEVKIPEAYKAPLDAYYEAGFMGMIDEPEIGGLGMPHALGMAVNEILVAATLPGMMYPGLSHGAMLLIANFFPEGPMKDIIIEKMMSGEWGGTMGLTEPDAGSDVGALKTKAVKQDDGTYRITGSKIFISSGDNDYYSNMIHPVLARIEGDPAGTKGISIFMVPKFLFDEQGNITGPNDMNCSGIEHKMGIHGSATCSLAFGDEGACVGYLMGEERKGMKIMFQMMNEARLGVGMQGQALASAGYMHAITYAKNRIQGVHVTQMLNPEATGVPIIQHPDVKRMLLWMKAHVEGMRHLNYFLAHNLSLAEKEEGEVAKQAKGLVEILIPICKAGNTDKSLEVTSEAMQVYGGYGYSAEYPVEMYMRDAKITQIYEGTNGIQSMDLTMRKILMNPEQYNLNVFVSRMKETIDAAKGVVDDKYITPVERGIEKILEVIEMMKGQMAGGKFMHLFMNATPLQQAMHQLALAWTHLWALNVAIPKMKELVGDLKGEERDTLLKDNADAAYYSGRVLSAQFYIGSEFPKFFGRIEALLGGESAVIKASDAIFTGAPEE